MLRKWFFFLGIEVEGSSTDTGLNSRGLSGCVSSFSVSTGGSVSCGVSSSSFGASKSVEMSTHCLKDSQSIYGYLILKLLFTNKAINNGEKELCLLFASDALKKFFSAYYTNNWEH